MHKNVDFDSCGPLSLASSAGSKYIRNSSSHKLALGHNTKAVHRAYAKRTQVTLPLLEDYERDAKAAQVITLP